jgi:hypothetical protein
MNYSILPKAGAAALLILAIPAAQAATRAAQGVRASTMVQIAQTGSTMKLAMGPTSAARLPGGTANQASDRTSNCSASTHYTSTLHNSTKYRHKPAAQN